MTRTSTYAILQVSAAAYADVRQRIVAVDEGLGGHSYQDDMIFPASRGEAEHLHLDGVALEALPAPEGLEGDLRDEIAEILETVARDGLKGPRDLDVALDAIGAALKGKV